MSLSSADVQMFRSRLLFLGLAFCGFEQPILLTEGSTLCACLKSKR
jgi:hypothetical protein